jgi:hypothetical protein
MKSNESLSLSLSLKETLKSDLSHAFSEYLPLDLLEEQAMKVMPKSRDRIFTPANTVLTMLLTSIQEDKSLQNGLNIFKTVFETRCREVIQKESVALEEEKSADSQEARKQGRPKKYKTRLPMSYHSSLSNSTAGYATARKKIDAGIIETVYSYSTDFGILDNESWYGMRTYISDGTYLQLQDTEDIKSRYAVKGLESSYPQALLQVLIRQGSGQVSRFAPGSRQDSELQLVIPMIKNLEKNSLLLADDLYNTYYHFNLILSRGCHMIVPGKRERNYKIIKTINDNDRIVEIAKTTRPDYVSQQEWNDIPKTILLRRITYTYPTKNGVESAVLFTTILDERIKTSDIITKYAMRWDIEISILEVKTIMDINVLRSKSRDMMRKELLIALTAYNMSRKVIAKSAGLSGFPPQEDIFQKCSPFSRNVLLDKRGRVFSRWSPGRYGYAAKLTDQQTSDTTPKREKKTLYSKY